jgi:shikimate dehydrogenase
MSTINARTDLVCLFGKPAKHSLSPIMHNAAFAHEHFNAVYLAFEVDSIEKAIEAMRTLPIHGASITYPYKTDVLQLLDSVDETARRIGAVNTIINKNGVLTGFNSDGFGACSALLEATKSLSGKKVLLLGSGGASRSISFSLLEKDAAVTIASRMGASQTKLVEALRTYFKEIGSCNIHELTSDECASFDIIINCTPLGMKESDELPIPAEFITSKHILFDIIYHPAETPLIKAAKKNGAHIIYGIEMLAHQGIRQFEIWTGKKAPFDVMKKALSDHLA